jgi:hypothetical protein
MRGSTCRTQMYYFLFTLYHSSLQWVWGTYPLIPNLPLYPIRRTIPLVVSAVDKLRLASLPKLPRSSTYAPVRLRSRYFRRLAILVSEQPWLENGPLIILSASYLNDRRISSATKNVRHRSGRASRRQGTAFLFKDDFCSSNDSSNFG